MYQGYVIVGKKNISCICKSADFRNFLWKIAESWSAYEDARYQESEDLRGVQSQGGERGTWPAPFITYAPFQKSRHCPYCLFLAAHGFQSWKEISSLSFRSCGRLEDLATFLHACVDSFRSCVGITASTCPVSCIISEGSLRLSERLILLPTKLNYGPLLDTHISIFPSYSSTE